MKYLHIHTAIWFLICVIILLVYILLYILVNIISLIWNIRFVSWSKFTEDDYENIALSKNNTLLHVSIREDDKNPIETLWRIYHWLDFLK